MTVENTNIHQTQFQQCNLRRRRAFPGSDCPFHANVCCDAVRVAAGMCAFEN